MAISLEPTELEQKLIQQAEQIAALQAKVDQLMVERTDLLEQLRTAIRKEYGRSSEAAPGQHDLFDEAEQVALPDAEVDTEEGEPVAEQSASAGSPRKRGRKPLPAHLPRVEVVYELDEAQRTCTEDGSELKVIGEEVTEQLDVIPATVRVIRRVRKTYSCPACETVQRAPRPAEILPKSRASVELLTQVAMYKYQDAMPLYRQEQLFQRFGLTLDRGTMANWMVGVGQKLLPLIDRLRHQALQAELLHADETTVQVIKEPGREAEKKSYMWLQTTGTGPPVVLYHYAPSRAQQVVSELFGDYGGTLVTDGYQAYQCLGSATHAGCWAHARRKFHDALKLQKGRTGRAQVGFNFIQKLFQHEKAWQDLEPSVRLEQRRLKSAPVVKELEDWLAKSLPAVTPKSQLGRALTYLHNQWDKLQVFLKDGAVPIHNNLAENKIRPFVIGRKNWLFSYSATGAESSAAIYSIIETAKANDLAPDMYLRWLFRTLPNVDQSNTEALDNLLPHRIDSEAVVRDLARWEAELQGTGN